MLSLYYFSLLITLISAQYVEQPQVQYTPQYLTLQQNQQISPVYQSATQRAPRPPPPPPQQPPTGITQLLLPSATDRQVQQAANNLAGPHYAQQVQSVQLQGLADEIQAIAQRRAQLASQRIQQANRQYLQQPSSPQYQQPPSPQYQQSPSPQYRQAPSPQYQQAQPAQVQPVVQYVKRPNNAVENVQTKEDYDPNPSYQFGFDVKDDYYTNYQNRKEQRTDGKISGSYSVVDADGFLRTVTYTADPKEGFKAEVNRQPTNIVIKNPKPVTPVAYKEQQQQQQYIEGTPEPGTAQPKYVYQYQ